MSKLVIPGVIAQSGNGGGGGGGDSVIKDYEAPSYTINTTLFTSPLPIPNLDALTEAGTYRVHFDMDIEGTTTTVTYIADVSPIKVSDTLSAYMQNLYVGPGAGDSVSIVRSGMIDGSSIIWADWSGNSIAEKQNKTLSSAITVGGVSQTTVEGALGAINTNTDGALKNTATGTNSLTITNNNVSTTANNTIIISPSKSNTTSGNYSTIIGDNAGGGSEKNITALGYSAQVSASFGTAIGADSRASGNTGASQPGAGTAIGYYSTATGGLSCGSMTQSSWGIAIGRGYNPTTRVSATAQRSIAIGVINTSSEVCSATAQGAIQLGNGTNSTTNSFQVFNYQMLDGTTGKIPVDRLPIPQYTWYTGNTGTSITIVDTSNANLVLVYKNGLLLQPPTEDSDSDAIINDYSISGTTLTLTSELIAADKITVAIF